MRDSIRNLLIAVSAVLVVGGSACSDHPQHEHIYGPISCNETPDCPIDTFCSLGCCRIVDGCTHDSECGPLDYCDCDGLCYQMPCAGNEDCATGLFCDELGTCKTRLDAAECGSDADCPCGTICSPDGQCSVGCATELDCCENETCGGGACHSTASCEADGDCPDGSYCDTGQNACVTLCSDSASCPAGSACAPNGLCYQICSSTIACTAPGTFCGDDGFCQQGTQCRTDADCEADQFCGAGAICTDPIACESDDDCEERCDSERKICVTAPR